jgi:NAD(P)-dependent dehydrogenase (short-subunit alcohol dehydrogenase family)
MSSLEKGDGGGAIGDRAPQESPVILITGSTSGLGREVALELARTGAHIIVHGRDLERGREVVSMIEEAGGSGRFFAADFASLDEVESFAETVLAEYTRLDVLINNAGIWLQDETRQLSVDGHELHFQVNYLSHFKLTYLLLPLLRESAPARIVNVASGAQTPLDFDDLMMERDYSDSRGYAQSKLAQILFTVDLSEELEGTGVVAVALHPATMMDTNMVLSRGARVRSSVSEGVEAVLHAVSAPDVESGEYFDGTRPARASGQTYDAQARARLRAISLELTGLSP